MIASPFGLSTIDGSYGLSVWAAVLPSFVEFWEAVETGVASGTYGTSVMVGPAVPSVTDDWTTYRNVAPNDGLRRQIKARHVRDGATTSVFTAVVTVAPWGAPAKLPLSPPTRTIPYADDANFAVSATTNDGLTAHTNVVESGGKKVNRLLAKALAGDSDSLDGTPDGSTYLRPRRIISSSSTAPAQFLFSALNGSTTSPSEVSLASYNLPAGTLSTNGDTLRITMIASLPNASDHALIKFGSTILFTASLTAGVFIVTVYLTRTGAATEVVAAVNTPPSGVPNLGAVTSAAETLSGSLTIDFRAQSISGGSVKIVAAFVEFMGV